MIEEITGVYTQGTSLVQSNPMLSTVFAVWGLSVITIVFWRVPSTIFRFIKEQYTTTFVVRSYGPGTESAFYEHQYQNALHWINTYGIVNFFTRIYTCDKVNQFRWTGIFVPGEGRHVLWYKRRLVFINIITSTSDSGSGVNLKPRYDIIFRIYGRNVNILKELYNEFKLIQKDEKVSRIYSHEYNTVKYITSLEPRSFDTVILNKTLKTNIINIIDSFIANKDWYRKRGIPYKLTIVLHGEPGTGKTSIIKAISSHTKRNLRIVDLNSNSTLSQFVDDFESTIVVYEDIDSHKAAVDRTKTISDNKDQLMGITVTELLNTLDGLVELNNVITFITTNHIDKLDPALLRKGRVDHIFEIKKLEDPEIREYIKLMFPSVIIPENLIFSDISGCDLQSIFFDHHETAEAFIYAIPKQKVYNG